ncbi:hypothetical protein BN6_50070 [Saccharothrix espanaensis DSM 44229]|uniref:Uncharacterized protein n=1 Tax=Saccharothrix espanaensis (strain ATCC 51144 / DSM 44229 / JCM 9112 / NBRC 15066 / NRRL 15764) TaxID=1179773 RepID=K0JWP3_SACES|nr:hypothetical protein BN6_50070 [Saccharothrix espanaensis DSM 44229]
MRLPHLGGHRELTACGGTAMTPAQWERYFPDLAFQPPC